MIPEKMGTDDACAHWPQKRGSYEVATQRSETFMGAGWVSEVDGVTAPEMDLP